MKDSDKIKNSLIDEFYNEAQESIDYSSKYSDEYLEFKSKLNHTKDKLAVLNEDIFNFDIDTLSIIEQGENIRKNRKAKKELLLFILSSFIIISLYVIAITQIGSIILIISQIIFVILMPWIIIPVVAMKKRGREI